MWICDTRLINYLWLKGYMPAEETNTQAYFKKSNKLYALLELFHLEYDCFPNRL